MAVPKYRDLNQHARELINNGYNYGHYRAEFCFNKLCRGFLQYNGESMATRALFRTLHHWPKYGLKFKTHLSSDLTTFSDVTMVTRMSVRDQFVDGLKLSYETSFMPIIGKKAAQMMVAKREDDSLSSALVQLDFAGTLVSLSHVRRIPDSNWLIGARYDATDAGLFIHQSLLYPLSLTLAYISHPLSASLSVSQQTDFQLTTHKRVSENLKVAAMCDWSTLTNQGKVVVGGKYESPYGILRVKGNSLCQLSGSYQFDLLPNLTFLLAAQLECSKSSAIGHKMGLGVKLKL